MKITHLALISIILFSCSREKKSDLTEENIKGNVKSITTTSFYGVEKFGEIQKGALQYKWNIQYDMNGNKTERNNYRFSSLIEDDKYKYIYDNNGNEIEMNHYLSDGSLDYKYKYEYDNDGNKTVLSYYLSNGSLSSKSTFKYDKNGNEIEQISESMGMLVDSEPSKWISKYNKNGNKTEVNFQNSFLSIESKTTYKYDNNGNEIEKSVYDSDGSLQHKETSKYDNDRHQIGYDYYGSDGSLKLSKVFSYKYDSRTNWIEQITVGTDNTVTEREIEYYD